MHQKILQKILQSMEDHRAPKQAALKYAHEREAFGKPIAHHQMITTYLADMATRIDAARLLVYKASWAKEEHYENGGPRHTKEAEQIEAHD